MELVLLWRKNGEGCQKVEQAVRKWSKGPALVIVPVSPHIRDRSEGRMTGGTSSKKPSYFRSRWIRCMGNGKSGLQVEMAVREWFRMLCDKIHDMDLRAPGLCWKIRILQRNKRDNLTL
jgi:hypothetical protein